MLYDVELRFIFFHIPRTAGVSISKALVWQCSDHCYLDLIFRHQTAAKFLQNRGEKFWASFDYKFAVMRPPWEIVESDYRLTMRDAEQIGPDRGQSLRAPWYARVMRAKAWPSFERFVQEEWLGESSGILPGGIWRTYCLGAGGRDLGVEPIRFHNLAEDWPAVCARIGVPCPELPHVNHAPGRRPKWTAPLRDGIGELCIRDIEQFGFQPPPV